MNLENPCKSTGEWLKGTGPLADVVVSSRIRLARNLSDHAFLASASHTERTEIFRAISHEIAATSIAARTALIDVDAADPIDRHLLVERHLISRQHLAAEGSRGVNVSDDETQALMINEEDHLRIQGLRSGLQLDAIWKDVNVVDDELSSRLPFAFDDKLGYLTACPTNVGTGIRVSVMLHLPALRLTKEIERVARAARDLKLAVRGMYGEGTEAIGDLYQVSNQTTLGKTETGVIETFTQTIIPKIVDYERVARQSLRSLHDSQVDDKIWRAFGTLTHARRISSGETQALLSPIRMGIHLERFRLFDIAFLNELFLFTQPAHLQKMCGQSMDEEARAIARADYLRQRLSKLPVN